MNYKKHPFKTNYPMTLYPVWYWENNMVPEIKRRLPQAIIKKRMFGLSSTLKIKIPRDDVWEAHKIVEECGRVEDILFDQRKEMYEKSKKQA